MTRHILAALSDRYRVERELGRGGTATVYLATDLKHHRRVAIKVLRQDLAMSLGQQALEVARTWKQQGNQAYALRLLGEIAAQREPPESALGEDYYHQALALAEAIGMRPLQAHCHRGLGSLYAKTGQVEQARAELWTAITMYQSMEMTFWLPEAEAALAQVDAC